MNIEDGNWFRCQKCKKVFYSEVEASKHSKDNEGHNHFDFKLIGVIKEVR
jgi:hypothetical protein